MGSSRCTLYAVCTLIVLGAVVVQGAAVIRLSSCGEELLRLECRSRSIIAIHEAYATTGAIEDGNVTCPQKSSGLEDNGPNELEGPDCDEDLRIIVNRRCSGMKRCNYRYSTEVGRRCNVKSSTVVVRYACVKESSIYRYCNTRLHLKEGYIASPGYPLFYPHLKDCRWFVDASDGQVIVFHPLHVHLRPPTIIHHDEEYPIRAGLYPDIIVCDVDYLRIEEGSVKKSETCGETLQGLQQVKVEARKGASINFVSKQFFPASGILMYFKVRGCATPTPHEDMELVYRRNTDALYRCLDDRVFNDTMTHSRLLRCVGEHRWNDTINVACVDVEVVELFSVNGSQEDRRIGATIENMTNDEASGQPISQRRTSYVEDIIVPAILMTLLVIGNTIIIGIIFVIRRRHEKRRQEEQNQTTQPEEAKDEIPDDEIDVNDLKDDYLLSHRTTRV